MIHDIKKKKETREVKVSLGNGERGAEGSENLGGQG